MLVCVCVFKQWRATFGLQGAGVVLFQKKIKDKL